MKVIAWRRPRSGRRTPPPTSARRRSSARTRRRRGEEAPAPAPPAEDAPPRRRGATSGWPSTRTRAARRRGARKRPRGRRRRGGAGTRSGRRRGGRPSTVPDPGRRAELPRAAAQARARGPSPTRRRARAPGRAGAERPLWRWWWTVRAGRRPAAAGGASPLPPSAWRDGGIRRASSARLRQLRPAAGQYPPRGYPGAGYGPPPGRSRRSNAGMRAGAAGAARGPPDTRRASSAIGRGRGAALSPRLPAQPGVRRGGGTRCHPGHKKLHPGAVFEFSAHLFLPVRTGRAAARRTRAPSEGPTEGTAGQRRRARRRAGCPSRRLKHLVPVLPPQSRRECLQSARTTAEARKDPRRTTLGRGKACRPPAGRAASPEDPRHHHGVALAEVFAATKPRGQAAVVLSYLTASTDSSSYQILDSRARWWVAPTAGSAS